MAHGPHGQVFSVLQTQIVMMVICSKEVKSDRFLEELDDLERKEEHVLNVIQNPIRTVSAYNALKPRGQRQPQVTYSVQPQQFLAHLSLKNLKIHTQKINKNLNIYQQKFKKKS